MTIDTIRQLLVRYYEGNATVSETDILKSFFSKEKEIPEDLTTDAAIFRALASHENTDYTVPKDLKKRIIAATTGRSRHVFSLKATISVAASLAVLICLSVIFITKRTTEPYPQHPSLASAETHNYFNVSESVEIKPLQTITTNNFAQNIRQLENENHYREITDSAEVVEITQLILEKINNSLSIAEHSVKYADASVDIFNKPINYSTYTLTINL